MNKINIRSSMLPSYADCCLRSASKQFKRLILDAGYTLRELPKTVGIPVGNGVHAAVKMHVEKYIETGVWGNVSESIDIAIDKYKSDSGDGIMFDATTVSGNEAEKQIITAVKSFVFEVTPHIKPIETEKQYNSIVDNEFSFTGSPDLIDESEFIDDIKGGAKCRPYHSQLGGYGLLRKTNGYAAPKGMRLWHLPRVSTKKTYPGAQKIEYDVSQCVLSASYTIKLIQSHVRNFIKTGSTWAFPANPMSMLCSDKFCPAWGTDVCKYFRKD